MKLASDAAERLGTGAGRASRGAAREAARRDGPGRPATRVASPARPRRLRVLRGLLRRSALAHRAARRLPAPRRRTRCT
jgi:hypothetical protein